MASLQKFTSTVQRPKPILGIRARLVILALLAVVPLMLDRVRVLEASRAERVETAAAEAVELARRGADAHHEIMSTTRALLRAVARAYALSDKSENCASYLAGFRADLSWLKSFSVIGADGRITCSTLPLAVGLYAGDRSYVRDAIETGDFVLSDYLLSRTRSEPAIMAAYPTRGKERGNTEVLVSSIDLQWLARLNTSVTRHPGAVVTLVDGKGTIVARNPEPDKWRGNAFAEHPLVKTMLASDDGTITLPDLDGIRRIVAFTRVPWSDARLAVGLDEGEVLSRVDREIYIAYMQLGFFGLLALLGAWFAGERLIVDPIRSLVRTATRIGRGELVVRPADEVWVAEFEPLAIALDESERKLAERERELRAANRHLEELASIDSLSALANRRGFDTRLATEWQRASKQKQSIGLLMVDVDHFKLFNDTYGHVEGDNCLRTMGELLASVCGPGDLPARYGGEEFALLLPGATMTKTLEIAERLRRAVEQLCIVHQEAPAGTLTVSIGAAALVPSSGQKPERLVEAADAGLYAAKRRGRNTVVAHSAAPLAVAS